MLTPNEHLTGSTHHKREIYDRLARFRADPRRTLKLADRYPHLTFGTLDAVAGTLSGPELEVFETGVELARDRLADLGQTNLLPRERVFVAVSATTPAHGGFHHRLLPHRAPDDIQAPGYRYVQAAAVISRYGDLHAAVPQPCAPGIVGLDLLHAYIHDTFHYLTHRAFRLGANGIHRNQHGINFRRESGQTYSARDPQGSASTRNLGIVMEGAFDREAAAIAGAAVEAVRLATPVDGIDAAAFRDAIGARTPAPDGEVAYLASMNGYAALVTAPYAAFLADVGGPEETELHELIIRATLDGNLESLQTWLDRRYGPGEFAALFRSGSYATAAA